MGEEKKHNYIFKKTTRVASRFHRWDHRGKSSKDMKIMIDEMRDVINTLVSRHSKLKYAFQKNKESWVAERKQLIAQNKEDVKNSVKESLKELRIKHNKRIAYWLSSKASWNNKVKKRDETINSQKETIKQLNSEIRSLNTKLNKLTKKYDELVKRKPDKVVKFEIPPEVKRLRTLVSKSFSERGINHLDFTLKLNDILSENNLSLDNYNLILKLSLIEIPSTLRELETTYAKINRLINMGYIKQEASGIERHGNIFYLTPAGHELIKNINNHLTFSKSKLSYENT